MTYDLGLIGDSLDATRNGVTEQDTFLYKLANARHATYINQAISGQKIADMKARFPDDILANDVTHNIFSTGFNDAYHLTPLANYKQDLREMIKMLQDTGARALVLTPMQCLLIGQNVKLEAFVDANLEVAYVCGADSVNVYDHAAAYASRDYLGFAAMFNLTLPGGQNDYEHYGPTGHTFRAELFNRPEYQRYLYLRRRTPIIVDPAGSPGSSGIWSLLANYVHDREANWSAYSTRTVISASVLDAMNPSEFRIFLRAGASSGFAISGARIGYNTGAYDAHCGYDAAPDVLTRDGSTSWVIPANTEDAVDDIVFSRPVGKNLVIAQSTPSGSNAFASGKLSAVPGVISWYKPGIDIDSLTADTSSGWTKASGNSVHILKRVEAR